MSGCFRYRKDLVFKSTPFAMLLLSGSDDHLETPNSAAAGASPPAVVFAARISAQTL